MTDEIVPTNGKELERFGGRDDIRELAERLVKAQPGAQQITTEQAVTLAQLAYAHDLDPWNGEVWYIPKSGVMVGIKGLRKAARRQAEQENGTFWCEFLQVDPEKYKAPEGSIVYECILRDTVTSQAWAKTVNTMTSAGVPYKEAVQMLGPCPITPGIGIVKPSEKSRMGHHQLARKRAEADAIKKRYDIHFRGASFTPEQPNGEPVIETVEAEYIDAEDVEPKERRPEQQIMAELGYGGSEVE